MRAVSRPEPLAADDPQQLQCLVRPGAGCCGVEDRHANTLRDEGITVNALSPGYVATDLKNHSGELTIEQSGAHIARQLLDVDEGTGVFLNENGGTYPW